MDLERLNIIHNWRSTYGTNPEGRRRETPKHQNPDKEQNPNSNHYEEPEESPKPTPESEHKVDLTI